MTTERQVRMEWLAKGCFAVVVGAAVFSGVCLAAQDRVTAARRNHEQDARALFRKAGVAYPAKKLLLRAFKADRVIELWAGDGTGPLSLVTTYKVCALSGDVGPKRVEGDGQIPEGIYAIDRFNPQSSYHLSLGLNYPNESDRKRSTAKRLGGDIFIHGECVTIGCLPIENGPIEELFVIALDARDAGAKPIPVHVFPARMTTENLEKLGARVKGDAALLTLWKELKEVQDAFDATHQVPRVKIGRSGEYLLMK